MIPTIWPRKRLARKPATRAVPTAVAFMDAFTARIEAATPAPLAESSGDYPIPFADATEARAAERRLSMRLDLADDPSYCYEAHEELTARLREFGGASVVGEDVAAAFERRIRFLDAQCPKAVAS